MILGGPLLGVLIAGIFLWGFLYGWWLRGKLDRPNLAPSEGGKTVEFCLGEPEPGPHLYAVVLDGDHATVYVDGRSVMEPLFPGRVDGFAIFPSPLAPERVRSHAAALGCGSDKRDGRS